MLEVCFYTFNLRDLFDSRNDVILQKTERYERREDYPDQLAALARFVSLTNEVFVVGQPQRFSEGFFVVTFPREKINYLENCLLLFSDLCDLGFFAGDIPSFSSGSAAPKRPPWLYTG